MIKSDEYTSEKQQLESYIRKNRIKVLLNSKSRVKLKIALALSYFGFDFMRSIFLKSNGKKDR